MNIKMYAIAELLGNLQKDGADDLVLVTSILDRCGLRISVYYIVADNDSDGLEKNPETCVIWALDKAFGKVGNHADTFLSAFDRTTCITVQGTVNFETVFMPALFVIETAPRAWLDREGGETFDLKDAKKFESLAECERFVFDVRQKRDLKEIKFVRIYKYFM